MSVNDASKRTNSLACERCRAQKLRCEWPSTGTDATCERCSRKGVQCRKNHSRRVGRPPRSRAGRLGSASLHLVDPQGISYLPPTLWQGSCERRSSWEDTKAELDRINPTMTTSGLASPPLSGVISHDVELMNFFASDMPTEWMTWSSDGASSINPNSVEPSNSSESLGSVSDNSDLSQKGHDTVNENPSEEDFQPEMPLDGTLARDVAGLTSCLFELVPSPPLQNRRAHPTEASKPSTDTSATIRPTTTTLRSILQYSETLRSMVTNSRYQSSKPLPGRADPDVSELALDGPTKLLLLSCYTKIFQAFRQIFADVYSGLKSGANMSDLLYDLRVEDVILDGDDDLKILVLMQVVTHKLNTLGMQLGIPEKHYISVGPGGGPEAAKQYQPRGRQQNSDVTEPTLDAILSGSGIDRCVFWGEHKEINKTMESAAAAFREELGLLRAQLGHRNRCRALSVAT